MIIKNARVMDAKTGMDEIADIIIKDEKIIAVGKALCPKGQTEDSSVADGIENDDIIIDAAGLVAAPGLIDVHVHFRDPGFTYKEDISSGAAAAARGGFTTVVCMANTKPAIDNTETLRYVTRAGKMTGIHVLSAACITMEMQGKNMTPMSDLAEAGAIGFTDDGIPIMDEALLQTAMKEAKRLGLPISLHEEDPSLIRNNGIHAGMAAKTLGIGGSPSEAESSLVKRDLTLALSIGADVNIQHISSKEAVNFVREAKEIGSHIHAEATPHHFSLTEDALLKYGTLAKMNPPLRTEEDRQAIIKGLQDGTIDLIATDHAPHSVEEKSKPLTEAPSGIIGLETSLALGITNLVRPGYLTLMQLLEKMTINPAKLYHLEAGSIEVGAMADLVLFDEHELWTVHDFISKSSNTPFQGASLYGRVKYTICEGRIVYCDSNRKRGQYEST